MTYPKLRITIAERTVSHVVTDSEGKLLEDGVDIVSSGNPVGYVGDLVNLVQEEHGNLWVGLTVVEAEE
jgi:hypothetical protein